MRARLLHPLLFMAFPALGVAAQSAGEYRLGDVLLVVALLVALTAIVLGLAILLLRHRRPPELAALLVTLLVLIFWTYRASQPLIGNHISWRLSTDRYLVPTVAVGMVILTALLVRWNPTLEKVSSFLTLTSGLAVALASFQVITSASRSSSFVENSALARDLDAPVPLLAAPNAPNGGARPDVYVVILDGYAGVDVLRDRFGFDNAPFLDSLRALGFRIPAGFRSNYSQTFLSIPSFLNFQHVTGFGSELRDAQDDRSLPLYLLRHNRTARFFKRHGYRFVFFPSAWWRGTLGNELADEQFRAWHSFNVSREMRSTEYRRSIMDATPLRFLLDESVTFDAEHVKRSFAGIEQLSARPEPTFALAHVLMPHRPYVLDATCRPLERPVPWKVPFGSPVDKRAYLEQLQCVNRLTLDLVTSLLAHSAVRPIIIIVGDHGTATLRPFAHPEQPPTREQVRERHGALGAFYLPDGGNAAMPDSVTLVNVFRIVLRQYFGADLPRLPDRLYFSNEKEPYRFLSVSDRYAVGAPLDFR